MCPLQETESMMREVVKRSVRPTDAEAERHTRMPAASGGPVERLLGLQQAAGNRAVVALLRQPASGPAPAPDSAIDTPGEKGTPSFEALSKRLWALEVQLVELNASGLVAGERLDLAANVLAWIGELGTPGERSEAQIAELSQRVDEFEDERAADRAYVEDWWKELTAAYEAEQQRLAESSERSDVIARGLLKDSYTKAGERMIVSGRFAWPYDVMPFATDLYERHHIQKGSEQALNEMVDTAQKLAGKGPHEDAGHWPWPEFEFVHHVVHGAHGGVEEFEQQKALEEGLDSAIRHNVDEAVQEMIELGESPDVAKAWAEKALEKSRAAAEDLLKKGPKAAESVLERIGGSAAESAEHWSGRLHIAGKLVVAIDIGASVIDIVASPPKEMPKKTLVQASRIAGGLAGAEGGASLGGRLGGRFGPEGAFVGGFIGAVVGGLAGAWAAESIAEFVVDEVWPPDDTHAEVVSD
jgi:hypothetical protein